MQAPQLPDSSSAVVDSLAGSLDRLSSGVTDMGRLVLSGEWAALGQTALEGATGTAVAFVPRLFGAVVVGVTFYVIYRVLLRVVEGVLQRTHRVDPGLRALSMRTFRAVGKAFIALMVLSQLGINLSALLAGLGIAGLALGFAAKDSLENFISGITILLDRPFAIGDWISTRDHYGRVTNITLRSTRLRTPQGETVIYPSVDMVTHPIINHSAGSPLRVDVPFGIAYKEDVENARRVVMSTLDAVADRLVEDGAHRVVVTGLEDSLVGMSLQVFARDPGDALSLKFHLTEAVRDALTDAGVEIPFPHLQLHVDGAKGLRDVVKEVQRA